jgi:hypothetical protein
VSLRGLFSCRPRRRDDSGGEVLLDAYGNPRSIVAKGRLIGGRAVDGSVIPVRERRVEDVGEPETEWVWNGEVWRNRWIS